MQKLFKNANLVDVKNGICRSVNLLINNGKIEKILSLNNKLNKELLKSVDSVVDLNNNYVLPPFVNTFCNSVSAFEESYLKEESDLLDENHYENYLEEHKKECSANKIEILKNIYKLMQIKNILAGAVCFDLSNILSNNFAEDLTNGEGGWLDSLSDKKMCNSLLIERIDQISEQDLAKLSDFVAKSGKKLFVKCGQTLDELGSVDLQYKKSLPIVLEDFGFLDRQPIIVGGNCFEKDDLELFSQYDCKFCITPAEDGKVGRRPTNLRSLKVRDLCVGLGSGNTFEIDFFAFMRQIIMTQRALFEQKDVMSEADAYHIATYGGANLLQLKDYGICEGNPANFIVVEANSTLYANVLQSLVWEKSKRDVKMTVLNGEILQKNGEIFMKNIESYDIIVNEIKQQIRREKNDN